MIKTLLRILIAIIVSSILLWPAVLHENWYTFAQSGIDSGKPKPKPKPAAKAPVKPKPKGDDSKSGHTLTVDLGNGVNMQFVRIPAGSFQMGSTDGGNNEKPAHHVTVGQSFYIGKYEVTQSQWEAVMGSNPSYFKDCGGNCPVEQVSWNDAQQFINRLNDRGDANGYRLPSEAEWEYVARAGITSDNVENLDELAWYYENSEGKTHPVGQKKPNTWGVYDMIGNVWEWVQDPYHDNYDGAPTDRSTWESGAEHKYPVLRGSSWNDRGGDSRPATRIKSLPDFHLGSFGFRVVVSASTP